MLQDNKHLVVLLKIVLKHPHIGFSSRHHHHYFVIQYNKLNCKWNHPQHRIKVECKNQHIPKSGIYWFINMSTIATILQLTFVIIYYCFIIEHLLLFYIFYCIYLLLDNGFLSYCRMENQQNSLPLYHAVRSFIFHPCWQVCLLLKCCSDDLYSSIYCFYVQ